MPHDHHDHSGHDHAGHDHGHAHHASHVHAPANFGLAFRVGIALNFGFVIIETAYGLRGHSVALLADAWHNLGDVLGLGVAWLASVLVKRPPSERFTYGLRGSSILAALFNSTFLLVMVGAISWEAILRLGEPAPVAGWTVTWVAAIGIAINALTAWLFASGRNDDLNLRGAYLHMASDALVAAGVVLAGFMIAVTGWVWLDPVVSLAINVAIVWGAWGLLKDSVVMSMAAVPPSVDPARVRAFLVGQSPVDSLHDLHIWPMSTTEIALTCHLVTPAGHPGDAFLRDLCAELRARFRIDHSTLQIETETEGCALAPREVV